ncbi:hypothetical protein ABXS75_03690 [Roseburia hominis]
MEETRAYRPNWVFRAAMVLLCMVLVLTYITAGLLAKYAAMGTGQDQARVASYDVTANMPAFETEIPVVLKPGESKEYTFTITNSSEVAVQMQAALQTEGNLPLKIEHQKGTAESGNWQTLTGNIQTESGTTCTWSDPLAAGDVEEQTYRIRISWAENCSEYQYANGVEAVKLTITASQID